MLLSKLKKYLLISIIITGFLLININVYSDTISIDENVKVISSGKAFSVIVNEEGVVYSWGKNTEGQLGIGNNTNASVPTLAVSNLSNIDSVVAGTAHVVAIDSSGNVFSWGSNNFGELGNNAAGVDSSSNTAQEVLKIVEDSEQESEEIEYEQLSGIIKVAAGNYFSMALSEDGEVYTWGNNTYGQLGNNSKTSLDVATKLSTISDIVDITCGNDFAMALKSNGTIYSWGYNGNGQLGIGTNKDSLIPVAITSLNGISIKKISAGVNHALAIDSLGSVWSWGANTYRQLGYSGTAIRPAKIDDTIDFTDISAGNNFSLALKSNGTVWSWGDNSLDQGRLADEDKIDTPTVIENLSDIEQISAGYSHSTAIKNNGKIYSWGDNYYNQLGNSSISTSFSTALVEVENLVWATTRISIQDYIGQAETTIEIPIDVNFAGEIAGFQMQIEYDDSVLEIDNDDIEKGSLIKDNTDWTIYTNVPESGTIKIVGYINDSDIEKLGDGELVVLPFTILDVSNNTESDITIESKMISNIDGESLTINSNNGSVTVYSYIKGDINKDNEIDLADLISMLSIITGAVSNPTADVLFISDIDNSGGNNPTINDIDVRDVVNLVNIINS